MARVARLLIIREEGKAEFVDGTAHTLIRVCTDAELTAQPKEDDGHHPLGIIEFNTHFQESKSIGQPVQLSRARPPWLNSGRNIHCGDIFI